MDTDPNNPPSVPPPNPENNSWLSALGILAAFFGIFLLSGLINKSSDYAPAPPASPYGPYNNPYDNPHDPYNPYGPYGPNQPQQPPKDSIGKSLIEELQQAPAETINSLDTQPAKSRGEIYRQNIDSVVLVAVQDTSTTYESATHFMGSGVVISSSKYGFCVLTADHLLKSQYYKSGLQLLVYFKGASVPQKVKVAKQAKNYDAVLLQFTDPNFKPVKTAVLGQSALLNAGSDIFGIGSCTAGVFLLTSGYVCIKPHKTHWSNEDYFSYYGKRPPQIKWPTIILMDMTIISGFSGGPVYNKRGELVGITVGSFSDPAGIITASLPIDDLRKEFFNAF